MANLQNKSSKKPWSPKEDATLLRLIDEYGSCGSWPKIALHMEWRTGKQCRERYINQLDPNIKKTPWTIEEDTTIKRLHDQLGKKWSKFMDYLPGRSDNAIKNRWHVISRDNFPDQTSPAIPAINTAQIATTIKQEHKSVVRTKKPAKTASTKKEEEEDDEENEEPCESHHRQQHRQQYQQHPSAEEAEEALGCELLGLPLDNGDMDFDLCSFVAEDANAYDGTHYDCEDNNSTASSTYTPRTTNDTNELGDGEDGGAHTRSATGASLEYTYSKTNSVASSNGDTSGRSSPFDAQILSDLISLNEATPSSSRKPSLQCLTSHEPSSDDNHSTTSTSESPSPKSPMRISPKTNLNIQTNSLYDFDFYFDKPGSAANPNSSNNNAKAEGMMPPPAGPSSLSQRDSLGGGGGGRDNAVVWSLNPNEDLAQALEFLMSATNSPAHSMQSTPNGNPNSLSNGGGGAGAGGMRPPSQATRNFSASLPPMPQGLGSSSRSPSSSLYVSGGMGLNMGMGLGLGSMSADSPAAGARIRPFSGNLASVASLLSRSNSGCDQDMIYPLPAHSAPPLAGPAPGSGAGSNGVAGASNAPGGVGYNFHANINGVNTNNGLRLQVPFARPEHSPINHTHFSPACPDSKRPRSKNPSTFSW